MRGLGSAAAFSTALAMVLSGAASVPAALSAPLLKSTYSVLALPSGSGSGGTDADQPASRAGRAGVVLLR